MQISPGTQKSLDRIHAQVQQGAFYEAQQMYKTVYHRCRSKKQLFDSYKVLEAGSVQQLSSQQLTCGVELANMLVEAFVSDKVPASGDYLDMIFAILQALPHQLQLADPDSTAELDEISRFVLAALKWAHKQNAAETLVQRMHDMFAAWVLHAYGWRQLSKAAIHFSRGSDAAAYAAALEQVASESSGGGVQELPLFVARAVLQTLACAHSASTLRQLQHASALLDACKQQQPSLAQQPLVHFCSMLLTALAMRKHSLLLLLQSKYQPSLAVDPSFEAYLSSIEQVYFPEVARPAIGGGSLLAGLLRSLLAEGDESEDDD